MAGFFKKLFGGSGEQPTSPAAPAAQVAGQQKPAPSVLVAHMNGQAVQLDQIADQMFASGALGPGVAIEPSTGVLVAPAEGEVTLAFPTGHAFGLRTADGLEILIHVGFDTVELDGQFFEPKVQKGDTVSRGQVLVEFDLEQVKAAGYPVTTPLVITNAKRTVADVQIARQGAPVSAGDELVTITRLG